jgi:hypothetical protein
VHPASARLHPPPLGAGMVNSLFSGDTVGKTYHLGGPRVFTIRELVEFVYNTIREPYHSIYTPAGAPRGPGLQAGLRRPAPWGRARPAAVCVLLGPLARACMLAMLV